ncbi:hypothetical protein DFH09DRAFT_1095485 [Mycena vulgaris]|nr:hypothetical protein DFH09DRAFT_1095485 [Mycena vulgaris]
MHSSLVAALAILATGASATPTDPLFTNLVRRSTSTTFAHPTNPSTRHPIQHRMPHRCGEWYRYFPCFLSPLRRTARHHRPRQTGDTDPANHFHHPANQAQGNTLANHKRAGLRGSPAAGPKAQEPRAPTVTQLGANTPLNTGCLTTATKGTAPFPGLCGGCAAQFGVPKPANNVAAGTITGNSGAIRSGMSRIGSAGGFGGSSGGFGRSARGPRARVLSSLSFVVEESNSNNNDIEGQNIRVKTGQHTLCPINEGYKAEIEGGVVHGVHWVSLVPVRYLRPFDSGPSHVDRTASSTGFEGFGVGYLQGSPFDSAPRRLEGIDGRKKKEEGGVAHGVHREKLNSGRREVQGHKPRWAARVTGRVVDRGSEEKRRGWLRLGAAEGGRLRCDGARGRAEERRRRERGRGPEGGLRLRLQGQRGEVLLLVLRGGREKRVYWRGGGGGGGAGEGLSGVATHLDAVPRQLWAARNAHKLVQCGERRRHEERREALADPGGGVGRVRRAGRRRAARPAVGFEVVVDAPFLRPQTKSVGCGGPGRPRRTGINGLR